MKLTKRKLIQMIKEELAKEDILDKLKGSLGMGAEEGSKEDVKAQIKKVHQLAVELNAAAERVASLAMKTGELQRDLDRDDRFEEDSLKAIDDMLRITKAAVEMSSDAPGPGHEFAQIGNLMSPI
tara:strand:+ start:247 stop:621 length:375 start_codon:yes stop_codon:yes gene_type:complete